MNDSGFLKVPNEVRDAFEPIVKAPKNGQVTKPLLGGEAADLLIDSAHRFLLFGSQFEVKPLKRFSQLDAL